MMFTPRPEKQFEKEFRRRMDPYPVLETAHLRLRRVFREDAADLLEATSDPSVCRYEPWDPCDEAETRQWIETILSQMEHGLCAEWAMERRDDAQVSGLIHLNNFDFFNRSAEIGYWLRRRDWGQGFATEAVTALIRFALTDLRLDEITAVCHPANAASIRVLEKAGMKYQTTAPGRIVLRGESFDCPQYHITRWDLL